MRRSGPIWMAPIWRRPRLDDTTTAGYQLAIPHLNSAHMNDLTHLIGKEVLIIRGSRGKTDGPGRERAVRCMLDAVDGQMVHATLLEDDPDATVAPRNCGDSGTWHGHSFVRPLQEDGLKSENGDTKA